MRTWKIDWFSTRGDVPGWRSTATSVSVARPYDVRSVGRVPTSNVDAPRGRKARGPLISCREFPSTPRQRS